MTRDYDATPASLFWRAKSWYKLASGGVTVRNIVKKFTIERYIAFCFSLEFLLKALIYINKDNAKANILRQYGHKMGDAKNAVLEIIQDKNTKDLLSELFNTFPELGDRDVIKSRYGVLGTLTSYAPGVLIDDSYAKLLDAANKTIRKEWAWRKSGE
jgi:hypothetical protein